MVTAKIYRTEKEFIEAIKKVPKGSIMIYDEASFFPIYIHEISAKYKKELAFVFDRFILTRRVLRTR